MHFERCQRLVSIFQRYESTLTLRMLRFLHELERLQRIRRGENLPVPDVVDITVHAAASNPPDAVEAQTVEATAPPGLENSNSTSALMPTLKRNRFLRQWNRRKPSSARRNERGILNEPKTSL
jgi:hypothetical protein